MASGPGILPVVGSAALHRPASIPPAHLSWTTFIITFSAPTTKGPVPSSASGETKLVSATGPSGW